MPPQLVVHDIFRPDYGMFVYNEETRCFWFNADTLESNVEFQLVGVVLGLAIYNGVILDVHFPAVLYKKLLGHRPTFADLEGALPSLAKGLRQLLEFQGDLVEGTFCRSFEVEYECYGAMMRHELINTGASQPVNESNRERYVELYADWLLSRSVEGPFSAFAQGFHQVCGGLALSLLRHEELELLICGLPHLDFYELESNARYEGGYTQVRKGCGLSAVIIELPPPLILGAYWGLPMIGLIISIQQCIPDDDLFVLSLSLIA